MRKLFCLIALLTCFGLTCKAQAVPVVVERLPNGDLIVSVEGREYRALTPESAKAILERKAQLDLVTRERDLLLSKVENLSRQLDVARREVEIADRQRAIEAERAEAFRAQFEAESAARKRSEELIGKRGRVARFLDHPAVKFAALALPVVGMWRR